MRMDYKKTLISPHCPRTRSAVAQPAIWQINEPWNLPWKLMKMVLILRKRFHWDCQLNRCLFYSRFPNIRMIYNKTRLEASVQKSKDATVKTLRWEKWYLASCTMFYSFISQLTLKQSYYKVNRVQQILILEKYNIEILNYI